jgi:hypothetical protein
MGCGKCPCLYKGIVTLCTVQNKSRYSSSRSCHLNSLSAESLHVLMVSVWQLLNESNWTSSFWTHAHFYAFCTERKKWMYVYCVRSSCVRLLNGFRLNLLWSSTWKFGTVDFNFLSYCSSDSNYRRSSNLTSLKKGKAIPVTGREGP